MNSIFHVWTTSLALFKFELGNWVFWLTPDRLFVLGGIFKRSVSDSPVSVCFWPKLRARLQLTSKFAFHAEHMSEHKFPTSIVRSASTKAGPAEDGKRKQRFLPHSDVFIFPLINPDSSCSQPPPKVTAARNQHLIPMLAQKTLCEWRIRWLLNK